MGRLIDADKLSADMYHEAFEKDSDMQKWDSGCWIRYKMFENVLKAQPTVEPEAISKWKKEFREYVDSLNIARDDWKGIIEYIDELPSAQPEQRWIPVTERLPEEEGLYLVSVKNEHDRRYSKTCWFHGKGNWFARQDVIAWMPLPEPYRKE